MNHKVRNSHLLLSICIWLVSCQSSMTPAQVSEQFWQGLVANDITKIKKYSLKDSFSEQEVPHKISNISFGKIVIDGEDAEIETTLQVETEGKLAEILLTTFLQIEDKAWRVNYEKTITALKIKQDVSELVGGIQELAEEFSEELENSVEEFKEKALPEIKSKIEQTEQEIREKLPELKDMIDEFLEELEESIKESIPVEEEPKTQQT